MGAQSWQRCSQQPAQAWRPAGLLILVALSCLSHFASAQSTACGPSLNCVNGGQCNETPGSTTGETAFLCACPNGFSGQNCEVQNAVSTGAPRLTCGPDLVCLNGGVCNQTPGSEAGASAYLCACPNGYQGQDCGTPCGGSSQPACSQVNTAGPLAAPVPSPPTQQSATPAPTTAAPAVNPPANPGPVPTATQACGQFLVCQHGGLCNQTPGAQQGDGYFCACLNGFTGLDCSIGGTGQTSGTSSQATNNVAPVLTPGSTSTIPKTGGGGGGVKAWVIVVAIVGGLAGIAVIGAVAIMLVRRRRQSGGGALAYQRRDSAHAQMSKRGEFEAEV